MSFIEFDAELIKRYDTPGPRYTSYPTAVQFNDSYTIADYKQQAEFSNKGNNPLSLYFHLPFCDTICYYCGCNKVITKDRDKAEPYLQNLYKEIAMQAKLFDKTRKVNQLHWGGGTPTFISHDQMRQLMQVTRQHFNLHDDDNGEYSIEIDPREATDETISVLREIGFNRMSLGIQDFNPQVQKAVNRIQTEEQTLRVINAARGVGFKSISVDLIYGLPFQTSASFIETLHKIIDISPDRISVFNYAHMPTLFKPQRRINEVDLPLPSVKLEILKNTIDILCKAGYVYIGMDHFAKPDDELSIAQKNSQLYRNFQGYATHADCDLIGLGISSIGTVGNSFAQNVKTLQEYADKIDAGELAIFRGIKIDDDDLIRRQVIMQLICHFELDMQAFSAKNNIQFDQYFKGELKQLDQMQKDELLSINDNVISVSSKGRLLIRNICMVFDRNHSAQSSTRFSKAI